jgi:hypothetical protein
LPIISNASSSLVVPSVIKPSFQPFNLQKAWVPLSPIGFDMVYSACDVVGEGFQKFEPPHLQYGFYTGVPLFSQKIVLKVVCSKLNPTATIVAHDNNRDNFRKQWNFDFQCFGKLLAIKHETNFAFGCE